MLVFFICSLFFFQIKFHIFWDILNLLIIENSLFNFIFFYSFFVIKFFFFVLFYYFGLTFCFFSFIIFFEFVIFFVKFFSFLFFSILFLFLLITEYIFLLENYDLVFFKRWNDTIKISNLFSYLKKQKDLYFLNSKEVSLLKSEQYNYYFETLYGKIQKKTSFKKFNKNISRKDTYIKFRSKDYLFEFENDFQNDIKKREIFLRNIKPKINKASALEKRKKRKDFFEHSFFVYTVVQNKEKVEMSLIKSKKEKFYKDKYGTFIYNELIKTSDHKQANIIRIKDSSDLDFSKVLPVFKK